MQTKRGVGAISGLKIPPIGPIEDETEITSLGAVSVPGQGTLEVGKDGVTALARNRGGEFVFITRGEHTEIMLCSNVDINPPRFALLPVAIQEPIQGVLLDLDGTSIKSEPLWIEVIFRVTNEMRENANLPRLERFAAEDMPHVSGRTVPDHLAYCRDRYCPDGTLDAARAIYDRITRSDQEMDGIAADLAKKGKAPHEPAPGLEELLLLLKRRGVKVAMVTSGLHYKAWPELESAFGRMSLGPPLEFLDGFISAGRRVGKGQAGTMGDAVAKPWPNIYFEAARALGFEAAHAGRFVVVGDTASDVGSARTMGVAIIGVKGGNIESAGVRQLCWTLVEDLHEVQEVLLPYLPPGKST